MSDQRLCTQPRAWVPAAAAAAYTCHVSDLAREHQLGVTAAAGTVTDNVAYHMHASCVAPAAGLFTELWQWLSLPRCRCCCQLQCCCKCFKACHSATGILLPLALLLPVDAVLLVEVHQPQTLLVICAPDTPGAPAIMSKKVNVHSESGQTLINATSQPSSLLS